MTSHKTSSSTAKWITGLATVGAAASAQAALVQINLGTQLTATSNNLDADLTGDGADDIAIAGVNQVNMPAVPSFTTMMPGPTSNGRPSPPIITTFPGSSGSYIAGAQFDGNPANGTYQVLSNGAPFIFTATAPGATVPGPTTTGGIAITFTDPSIFGGAPTSAFLEIVADGSSNNPSVTLTRLVFDDGQGAPGTPDFVNVVGQGDFTEFMAVPEPSSLAMLALGAAGVVTRRQRKKVA